MPSTRSDAQEPPLPPDVQVQLISKILTFDRRVERYGPELVLGVVYQPGNRESSRARDELRELVDQGGPVRVAGLPLRVVDLPLTGNWLGELPERVDVVYVTPIRTADPRSLLRDVQRRGMLAFTASRDLVGMGAAVTLLVQEAQPHILIDLSATRMAGADFSSRLLRLAEVHP